MHILNINSNILKFESLLEQISRWRLPPDLYDTIILSLQSVNSVPNVLEVRIDSPIFLPTRSTQVRLHPNPTASVSGHASSHPNIPKLLSIATIGLAIISIMTMSLLISIHSKQLQSHHVAAATLDRGKRKIDRTSLRENRQPSEQYYGLAVAIMLCSYLLWVFGTLHATSRFLWTLARNLSYTIVRWGLEHPGAVMAIASNIFLGFDVFDALFPDTVNLQRYKTCLLHVGDTLYNTMLGLLWLPILSLGALVVFLKYLSIRVLSIMRRSTHRQRGPHVPELPKANGATEGSKLSGISKPQAGQSWLPIELSGGVFNRLDSTNIIGTRNVTEGGFGRLYQAVDARSGNMLAIKRVNRQMLGEDRGHLLLDEIRAHHRMHFDSRFPPLLGCFIDQHDYILVMPYFHRGDLSNFIQHSGGYLSRSLARFYCAELFLAIRSLHKARIIHGDLKPENILLDDNRHLIITDFGLATVFSKSEEREREYPLWQEAKKRGGSHFPPLWPKENPHTVCRAAGTEVYAAPEVFSIYPFSYGADYWSMGIIYHEMLTAQLPYDMTWRNGIRHVFYPLTLNLNQQSRHLQLLDPLSFQFLARVLSPIPETRPNVREMKKDRVWSKINWKAMKRREIEVPA